ncbi:MAG: hypothetical protein ACK5ZG_07500 [Phycisphaerae bacterium]
MADEHARTEYDALADLFLASDAARDPKPVTYPSRATQGGPALRLADQLDMAAPSTPQVDEPAAREALTVEALVLGHLPVLGAAWVTQYAKHVAEERRSAVALLRLHEGQAWIDIVMPRTAQARPQSRLGGHDEPATLEAALQHAARECSHWLVRVDEIAELELVALPHLSRVTLLTGADDAAVVASYRTIKNLSRSLDAAHAADAAAPSLKLAIMGADEAKATEAETKLRKAAATFLQNELEPAAKVAKIGGSSTLAIFRGHASMDIAAMLAYAHAPQARPAPQTQQQPEAQPASEAPVATPQTDVPAATPAVQNAASQPAVVAPPQAGPLPIPGLTPLAFVCPYAKHVTLAVAADNSLQLIAPAKSDAAQSLLAVAAWAHEHAPLLALAHPGLRCDQPTLHALADELADVRGLLDTAIIVHLVFRMGETTIAKRLN